MTFTASPTAVTEVNAVLNAIQAEHGVHLPLAIESGSRAWGFPSPDSDYDCRFVYVRPVTQHLSIRSQRDVIETPIHDDLDVNGWDMAKALRLILKGNAVAVEWLRSPITYRAETRFREEMLAFAESHAPRGRIATHYLHLGRRQRAVYLKGGGEVVLKKLFYALRPAAALRWLSRHAGSLPPMHFPTLLDESDVPEDTRRIIDDLIGLKAETREMGTGLLPPLLTRFIDHELDVDPLVFGVEPIAATAFSHADRLYATTVQRLDEAAISRDP